jgi:hypothetical protein
MHSGKAQKHVGKPSPSATLREELPGMLLTVKRPSPSVVLALGEDLTSLMPSIFFSFFLKKLFPECNTRGRNSFFKKESSSPSATLGEEI